MLRLPTYSGRRVAVFGLARSGLSAVRALAAGGAEVLAWDDDAGKRAAIAGLPVRLAPPDADSWAGITALVLSPGVPLTHPAPHATVNLARRLGARVIGDIELFAETRLAARVVGITGTNGKSTTTALIGHLLRSSGRAVAVGGNLGTPALDLPALPGGGTYVLELSSFQLDLTRSLRPQVAVWLNLTPDHLDRHGDLAGYIAAKRRLFDLAPADATLIVGIDDEPSRRQAEAMRAAGRKVVPIAVGRIIADGLYAMAGRIHRGGECLADLAGIETLRGQHNWQNAAASIAAGLALGLSASEMQAGLRSFGGLPHRMERIAVIDGVAFVNDSKATNAAAAARALASFETIYWISGGLPKAGGIASLSAYFPRIRQAFLIGKAAPDFAATLAGHVPCRQSGDLATAIAQAQAAAQADGAAEPVVLLSPACASFDQFANYEARGDSFRELVLALPGAPARHGAARC